MNPADHLFQSFWMAGFECSTQINSAGVRLDMTAALGHDTCAASDYRRLREVNIATARDSHQRGLAFIGNGVRVRTCLQKFLNH